MKKLLLLLALISNAVVFCSETDTSSAGSFPIASTGMSDKEKRKALRSQFMYKRITENLLNVVNACKSEETQRSLNGVVGFSPKCEAARLHAQQNIALAHISSSMAEWYLNQKIDSKPDTVSATPAQAQ